MTGHGTSIDRCHQNTRTRTRHRQVLGIRASEWIFERSISKTPRRYRWSIERKWCFEIQWEYWHVNYEWGNTKRKEGNIYRNVVGIALANKSVASLHSRKNKTETCLRTFTPLEGVLYGPVMFALWFQTWTLVARRDQQQLSELMSQSRQHVKNIGALGLQ